LLLLFFLLSSPTLRSTPEPPCLCENYVTVGAPEEETLISEITPFNNARCYFVQGTLVIDQDASWINMRIKMDEGAAIRVESGLFVANCHI